ncbi:hypothetical protein JYB88_10840 [Shewanella cyperi]|uniref:Uncharacterized protein n=1 Tax=Shewanella cyperi TaxID=2814292 RepID=A0A975AJJ1_9GAMM|nr:hypothetical protein [Shewanella cyperi]QSX28771.1 hypothetical protein JYB88_10840 [Shewanella cyperi]
MEVIKRIKSKFDNRHVDIVRQANAFVLELYETKYDDEEECEYTVRVYPNPSGRFETLELALKEAKTLMQSK